MRAPHALALALLVLAAPSHLRAQVDEPWREAESSARGAPGSPGAPGAPPTVAAIALSIRSRAIQDSRCYLMNGGAVESFFVSEDSPVGSVIGTLSVNGDPDEERGDITLRVQEKGAALAIQPGSKNLTLLRALDREERRGPSNVYVNVRCDRRLTTDPSFIIPVSVRVWDVNDNAPVWVGAPYRIRLSELTAVGSRVLQTARATDADQPGPHATIRYSVLPGPHSEYFAFANELDSVLIVKKPLDYESLHNFTLTLRAEDQGSPPLHNDTQLYVEVLDADDQNPRFTYEHYTAQLPDNAEKGVILATSPGPVSASDQDVGIKAPLHYSTTGDNKSLLLIDRDTGQVAASQLLLGITQPVTVVIKAVQVDNPDRYALATLTVTPARGGGAGAVGSDGAGGGGGGAGVQFSREQYSAAVSEAAPVGTVLLTLHTTPPAQPGRDQSPLQFFVSERSFLEKFAINSAGEVVLRRALDYELRDSYHYQVMVTDGLTNDTASINITVVNVNEWEPRFRYPQYEFRVEPPPEGMAAELGGEPGMLPVGKLDVFDGDKSDTVTLTLRGADADMFYMSPGGAMFLRQQALAALNTSVLHVLATAQDSGAPPRQTSVPVIVHVSERLMRVGDKSTGVPLVATLGTAAALLALLLCTLLLYMRRRRSKSSPSPVGKPYIAHEKTRSPSPPNPPAAPAGGTLAPALGGSGSLQSVSAGASTILANSSSSLDLRDSLPNNGSNGTAAAAGRQSGRGRSKVAPLPPAPGAAAAPAPAPGVSLMSDHLGAGAGRSGVAWPSAVIPARVKKLSWDDAADNKDSAEPPDTNRSAHEHMNLTVYF